MNLTRCPNCDFPMDNNVIKKGISFKWPFIIKFKCPECTANLKQTWYSMVYAWFVFGFFVYVSIYREGLWVILGISLLLSLFLIGYFGKLIVKDTNENT